MLEWVVLISLLSLGVGLIIAEVILIPGTTIVGIMGFLCVIGGIYSAFEHFGDKTGNIVLISSFAFLVLATAYALKAKTWQKIALEDRIDSKVNQDEEILVYVGCVAYAVSDLRPMGTIEFENQQYEAATEGGFIETGCSVKVIKLNNREIIVEKIN